MVEVAGDKALIARLESMPTAVQAVLRAKTRQLAINLQGHIKIDKLSGQVLNRKSGALSSSIKFEVNVTGTSVYGRVFSSGDVKYAAIHEYGGTIPAHDIVPNKAQALAFLVAGQQVFAKIVHMPAVQMPERSYMRSSLADMAEEISEGLKAAVVQGMQRVVSGQAA